MSTEQQITRGLQTDIRQLEAGVMRVDKERKRFRGRLTQLHRALKLVNCNKRSQSHAQKPFITG